MKQWEKIIGYSLLIITIFVIIFVLSLSVFRNFILRQAINYVNKDLLIKIEFDKSQITFFKTFPIVEFHFYEFKLIGKEPFDKDSLLYIPDIKINVNFNKVFKKKRKIFIQEINANQPILKLKILENGLANYYFLPTKEEIIPNQEPTKIIIETINVFRGKGFYHDYESQIFIKLPNFTLKFSNLSITYENVKFYLSGYFADADLKYKNLYIFRKKNITIETSYENFFPGCIDNYFFNGTFGLNNLKFKAIGKLKNTNLCDTINIHNHFVKIETITDDFQDLLSITNLFYNNIKDISSSGSYKINLQYFSQKNINIDSFYINSQIRITDGKIKLKQINYTINNINLLANLNITKSLKLNIDYANFYVDNNYFLLQNLFILNTEDSVYLNGLLNTKLDLQKIKQYLSFSKSLKFSGLLNSHIYFNGFINKKNFKTPNTIKISGFSSIQNFSFVQKNFIFKTKLLETYITNNQIFVISNNSYFNDLKFSVKLYIENYLNSLFNLQKKDTLPLFIKVKTHINSIQLNKIAKSDSSEYIVPLPTLNSLNTKAIIIAKIDSLIYKNLSLTNVNTIIHYNKDSLIVKSLNATINNILLQLNANLIQINKNLFIDFATDIKKLPISQLPNYIDFNNNIKTSLSQSKGTFDLGISGYFVYNMDKSKIKNLYLTGNIFSKKLILEPNIYTQRLSNLLKSPELLSPDIDNLNLYIRIQDNNIIIPRSHFTVSKHLSFLEGYYSINSDLMNFTYGIMLTKQKVIKLIHRSLTGEKNTYLIINIAGKSSDPKITFSSNLFSNKAVSNFNNSLPSTKAFADSLKAAQIALKKHKKKENKLTKETVKQTRQQTKQIMKKAREVSQQLLKQNTPKSRKLARKVLRNARKMKKQLKKQALNNKKNMHKQTKNQIDTLKKRYKLITKELKRTFIK